MVATLHSSLETVSYLSELHDKLESPHYIVLLKQENLRDWEDLEKQSPHYIVLLKRRGRSHPQDALSRRHTT